MSKPERVRVGRNDPKGKAPSWHQQKKPAAQPTPQRRYTARTPLSFYALKDMLRRISSHKNFPDMVAIGIALTSLAIAFPSFPLAVIIPLILATMLITMIHPLMGLMVFLFETLPIIIYQAPLLGWLSMIFISVSLFLGYRHYRTILFVYIMTMLPLSFLGSFLEMPAFFLGVLFIGLKRSSVSIIVILLLIVVFSSLSGIQNSGPFAYDSVSAHSSFGTNPAVAYLTANKSGTSLADFGQGFGTAFASFLSTPVLANVGTAFQLAGIAIYGDVDFIGLQIFIWLITVFIVSNFASKSRSVYKGTQASAFGLILLISYIAFTSLSGLQISPAVILGFFLAPLLYLLMESNGVNIVRTLDVAKQDFIEKFNEGVEEIAANARETLNDVANYDQTKEELKAAILAPIEHREISGAYNVKPAKGILLFGPPGTGKTLLMRALSNEIRGRFFYVKTSSLISPFQGESASRLAKIFATVKKHPPAILFFDEIDAVAGSRELKESDESRQLLSTLLGEMDGFQKIEGIVIVGSTNIPNTLDPSIMRPGRFDKIIYMSLPDEDGRGKIFKYYLSKLPIAKEMDFAKLAKMSNRYSGADIKNVCDEVARMVSEDAIKSNKVLEITMDDLISVISQTKPSTTISQLETYNTFKMDYERRMHPEKFVEEKAENLSISDVVGLENAKKAIYEAIEVPMMHPELIKKYDIRSTKGILLFGPPGTGKTMLMRAVASDIGDVKMFVLSGAELSKYGLERAVLTIKQTFDRAKENAPSVIFLDEIDSLLPIREKSSMLGVEITSEFLQEMDGIKGSGDVVVVGATNRPDALDPALLRGGRFDKLIFVQPPNKTDRVLLFERNLKKAPISKDMNFDKLGDITSGYTGADIANICRQAKMNALEESIDASKEVEITTDDLLDIINNTRPSAPNISMSAYLTFLSRYGRE